MPYCSSEQRLQGFDDLEAEITTEDLSDTSLSFEVHLNRPCASCGTEAGYYDLELSLDFEHECNEDNVDEDAKEDEATFELESSEVEPVDDVQTTDRHGKRITNPRYQRRLLGAQVTATIHCERCGETWDETLQDTVAASSFEVESSH